METMWREMDQPSAMHGDTVSFRAMMLRRDSAVGLKATVDARTGRVFEGGHRMDGQMMLVRPAILSRDRTAVLRLCASLNPTSGSDLEVSGWS